MASPKATREQVDVVSEPAIPAGLTRTSTMQPLPGPEFKRRLQLNPTEQLRLIETLDDDPDLLPPTRSTVRYDFSRRDLPFTVVHMDGFVSSFLVYGRNISSQGLSILHGGYVHPGTLCRIILPLVVGGGITVEGTIRHCRLVQDSCHEIGIEFDKAIRVREILGARLPEEVTKQDAAEAPRHIQLAGTVLLTAPKGPLRDMLQRRLEENGLTVQAAASAMSSVNAVRRGRPDVVLHSLIQMNDDGAFGMQDLRDAGYDGPIIALTADARPESHVSVLAGGASSVLVQPVAHEELLAQLMSYLGPLDPPSVLECTARDRREVRELLPSYLEFVHRAAERLEMMTESTQRDALREVCQYLRAMSVEYGFVPIAAAAHRSLRTLNQPDDADGIGTSIGQLASWCRSASE
ncbi:MAG: response regulator [Planctomycetota bacterium]